MLALGLPPRPNPAVAQVRLLHPKMGTRTNISAANK